MYVRDIDGKPTWTQQLHPTLSSARLPTSLKHSPIMGYLAELQRKNLETLMGAEAMGTLPEDTKFTDAKVCRNFLCGMCPHDLFTNTVSCGGAYTKISSLLMYPCHCRERIWVNVQRSTLAR